MGADAFPFYIIAYEMNRRSTSSNGIKSTWHCLQNYSRRCFEARILDSCQHERVAAATATAASYTKRNVRSGKMQTID